MSDTVRILLVDDDPMVRRMLRMILDGNGRTVVGEAADGHEADRLVESLGPDVVLMDIRMPGIDGLAATELIRSREDAPEVLILTTFDADEHVLRALRAGAAGFLLKDASPAELVDAVDRVVAGDAHLSPSVMRQVIDRIAADGPRTRAAAGRLARLTERELEVARAIADGLSNADIARRLYLSVPTVKAHVSAVLAKLEVSNRVQVALLVRDAGPRGDDPAPG